MSGKDAKEVTYPARVFLFRWWWVNEEARSTRLRQPNRSWGHGHIRCDVMNVVNNTNFIACERLRRDKKEYRKIDYESSSIQSFPTIVEHCSTAELVNCSDVMVKIKICIDCGKINIILEWMCWKITINRTKFLGKQHYEKINQKNNSLCSHIHGEQVGYPSLSRAAAARLHK